MCSSLWDAPLPFTTCSSVVIKSLLSKLTSSVDWDKALYVFTQKVVTKVHDFFRISSLNISGFPGCAPNANTAISERGNQGLRDRAEVPALRRDMQHLPRDKASSSRKASQVYGQQAESSKTHTWSLTHTPMFCAFPEGF